MHRRPGGWGCRLHRRLLGKRVDGAAVLHKCHAVEALRFVEHVGERDARGGRGAHDVDVRCVSTILRSSGTASSTAPLAKPVGKCASSKIQSLRPSCLHSSMTKRKSRHQLAAKIGGVGGFRDRPRGCRRGDLFQILGNGLMALALHPQNGSTWLSYVPRAPADSTRSWILLGSIGLLHSTDYGRVGAFC